MWFSEMKTKPNDYGEKGHEAVGIDRIHVLLKKGFAVSFYRFRSWSENADQCQLGNVLVAVATRKVTRDKGK